MERRATYFFADAMGIAVAKVVIAECIVFNPQVFSPQSNNALRVLLSFDIVRLLFSPSGYEQSLLQIL